ncbi:uncharacterized protein K452DRAFT_320151 [Aplosporella prunicola CBS 121167]|uniref:Uncharacterized protein n=1 Tax=Aplosporella prunicola CBS 121167 TaxID=1176127 RepID=A0A6A6BB00_9PEZI|nr:uncharacterized protein K452DRAFT_320151 [Aplosporella prunicola CBS 121167]KAF2140097.1 hypothetical protein K452DRAFT_320151 [Aplosporella prunicola CBS 121167]
MSALRAAVTKGVHLRIFPRPASLSESREVLRVLQQFGEVSTFKSLKFDPYTRAPNVCMAIYESADSAAKLLKASPLRFAIEHVVPETHDDAEEPADLTQPLSSLAPGQVEPAQSMEDAEFQENNEPSKAGAEEMIRPSQLLFGTIESFGKPQGELQQEDAHALAENYAAVLEKAAKESIEPEPQAAADAQPDTAKPQPRHAREFHLTADVLEMNHRDYIERTWWYWPYRTRTRSFAYGDLYARGVPDGIADIHTDKPQQPWRIVQRFRNEIAARPKLGEIGEMDVDEEDIDEVISREELHHKDERSKR